MTARGTNRRRRRRPVPPKQTTAATRPTAGAHQRPAVARPTKRSRRTGASRSRWAVNIALLAITLGGTAYLLPDHVVPPELPRIDIYTTSDGVRAARFDRGRLAAYCAAHDLAPPPALHEIEAGMASALFEALRDAGERRGASSLGRLGQVYLGLDCPEAAEAAFHQAHALAPNEFAWVYYLGTIADRFGRAGNAIDWFRRALELDPAYPVTYARLGTLYLDQDQDGDAAEMWRRYLELRPSDCMGHTGLGRVALAQGRHQEAIERFRDAIKLVPVDFQAHFYLATTYEQLGHHDAARDLFARSAELPRGRPWRVRDPLIQQTTRAAGSIEDMVFRFEQLGGTEQWQQLADLAERILARRTRDVGMMVNLAQIYAKQGRFAKARARIEEAIALNPDSPRPHAANAKVLLLEGRIEDALDSADRALALDPAFRPALDAKARAHLLLRQYDRAIATCRTYLAIEPAAPDVLFLLAESLTQTGDYDEAATQYRKVLKLRPDHTRARQRLEQLGHAPR